MWTKLFWKDAAERALKTFAQAILAVLIVAPQTSIIAFDWPVAIGLGLTAAVISVLTSIVSGFSHNTVSPASIAPDDRGI